MIEIKGLIRKSRFRNNEYLFYIGEKVGKFPIVLLLPLSISTEIDKHLKESKKGALRTWTNVKWIWKFDKYD